MLSERAVSLLLTLIPEGSTVLELGTGEGTARLAESFKVYSVENNPEWWIGESELLEVPLASMFIEGFPECVEWYDPDVLRSKIEPLNYRAIVVDGPASTRRRMGFWKYFDLFNQDVPIIFDDIHRTYDYKSALFVAKIKNASRFEIHDFDRTKQFGLVV